ncbi:DUF4190 domain-containing protein [Cellulosimicrobium marinum]|uniref:DUF4190 domain-containing protein n=1 Tax=Cellulosimicrobium marinum TaxID=1638992 RepID=UPI001E4738DA|nr:DUF4190 domain-containing protein [Cellulosimicrobium marinum]MCB7135113.1 DUF4190 domain-containing protein [Cellulosimicrobium marinum]
MTSPPDPPYGTPGPEDPYAPRRPQQPPLSPYGLPAEDDAGATDADGFAPPSGATYPASPYGPPAGYATGPSPQPPYPQQAYPQPGYPQQGYPQPGYPPASYPGSGYPPPAYAAYSPVRTNGLAVASMVVSVASLLLCLGLTGVIGLVLGIVALNQVLRDGTRGKAFAVTGIVVGAVGTVILGLLLIGLASGS